MDDDNEEKKKHPIEMTTDEAVEFLFPPEAIEHLKAVAHGEPRSDAESDLTPDVEQHSDPQG